MRCYMQLCCAIYEHISNILSGNKFNCFDMCRNSVHVCCICKTINSIAIPCKDYVKLYYTTDITRPSEHADKNEVVVSFHHKCIVKTEYKGATLNSIDDAYKSIVMELLSDIAHSTNLKTIVIRFENGKDIVVQALIPLLEGSEMWKFSREDEQ